MNPDPTNNPFDVSRLMAAWAQAYSSFAMGPSAATVGTSATDAATQRRLLELHLAVVNSGCRYLGRWAEISARRYPEFARALASATTETAATGSALGATLDSIRAFMREMAELPLEESKRLQTEIEAILGSGKPASEGPKSRPRRRARAKE